MGSFSITDMSDPSNANWGDSDIGPPSYPGMPGTGGPGSAPNLGMGSVSDAMGSVPNSSVNGSPGAVSPLGGAGASSTSGAAVFSHGSNPANIPGTVANFLAQVAASVAAASAQEAVQFTAAGQHTPTRYAAPWWFHPVGTGQDSMRPPASRSNSYRLPPGGSYSNQFDPLFSIGPDTTNDHPDMMPGVYQDFNQDAPNRIINDQGQTIPNTAHYPVIMSGEEQAAAFGIGHISYDGFAAGISIDPGFSTNGLDGYDTAVFFFGLP